MYPGKLFCTNVLLRAWTFDASEIMFYQIYVSARYEGDWRFYEWAFDSDGKELETTVIDRDVISASTYSASFSEILGLNIDREYLENHRSTGIRFQIAGKGGKEIVSIPSTYVTAFLEKMDELNSQS